VATAATWDSSAANFASLTGFAGTELRILDVEDAVAGDRAHRNQRAADGDARPTRRLRHAQKLPLSETRGEPPTKLVASCVEAVFSALK
jgi:hypothetical protein